MIENLQLGAYVKDGRESSLLRIPITDEVQVSLSQLWSNQYDRFTNSVEEVAFDPGYTPNDDERFVLNDFVLPEFMQENREAFARVESIGNNPEVLQKIRAIIGLAVDADGRELRLFQKFSRSHVVRPGRFLLMQNDTFETMESPCLTLGDRLDVVYHVDTSKLLFSNFRTANTMLPLMDQYSEASEQEIRDILQHRRIRIDNPDALAVGASQWFKTRFSMLRDSTILDDFSPTYIKNHADGFGLNIETEGTGNSERIVFPEDKTQAKKLLQFLNEEIYKGPITDTLYETNSKREAD